MGSFRSWVLSVSLAMALTVVTTWLFRPTYLSSANFVNSRAKQFLNFLNTQNPQTPINLIFGSSELFVNFSATQINSFLPHENYFYLMSSPDFSLEKQAMLIDKIKKGQVKKVILPLSLASLGKSHFINKTEERIRFVETIDHSDIWHVDSLKFTHKLEASAQKILHVNDLRDMAQWLWAQRENSSAASFSQLWLNSDFVERPFWNIETQGDFLFNQKHSPQFQLLSGVLQYNDKEHAKTVQYYENCCQLLNLKHLDLGLMQLLKNISAFEELGAEVYVVYFPSSPQVQAMRTAESQQYLQDIKKFMQEKFAQKFIDLELQIQLNAYDYLDAVHLSKKGQEKVQRALAESLNKRTQ